MLYICLFNFFVKCDQVSDFFVTSAGTNKSNGYNVVLIGESSVGKSSFMKRALSGKFTLDIPASVGKTVIFWIVLMYTELGHSDVICRPGFLQVECGGRWKTCAATVMGYSRSRKVSVTLSVLKRNELEEYVAMN